MPQEHSYFPHDGSALQESHSRARILSKKVQWIAVSCHDPCLRHFLAHLGGELCTVNVSTNAIPDREQL